MGGSHWNTNKNLQFYTSGSAFSGLRQIHISCHYWWRLKKTVFNQSKVAPNGRSWQDVDYGESHNSGPWLNPDNRCRILHWNTLLLSLSAHIVHFFSLGTYCALAVMSCLDTSYYVRPDSANLRRFLWDLNHAVNILSRRVQLGWKYLKKPHHSGMCASVWPTEIIIMWVLQFYMSKLTPLSCHSWMLPHHSTLALRSPWIPAGPARPLNLTAAGGMYTNARRQWSYEFAARLIKHQCSSAQPYKEKTCAKRMHKGCFKLCKSVTHRYFSISVIFLMFGNPPPELR